MLRICSFAMTALLSLGSMADAQTIILSTKAPGSGSPFWAAVEQGATDKAAELGATLVVLAPPMETDVDTQVAQLEEHMSKDIDGLALAPTDPDALAPIVDKAVNDDIPVVYVDTLGANESVPYIGTNNEEAALLATDFICANAQPNGNVAILQGVLTHSTGQIRAEGAAEGLADCGLNIVAEVSAEWDRAKGKSAMAAILAEHPDISAVFASNDQMALGAVEALKEADALDDTVVVGFDALPEAATSILAEELTASVAQDPYRMGALAVENLVGASQGRLLPASIDTGTQLVTKQNAHYFE